jgi:hypothetical protein
MQVLFWKLGSGVAFALGVDPSLGSGKNRKILIAVTGLMEVSNGSQYNIGVRN